MDLHVISTPWWAPHPPTHPPTLINISKKQNNGMGSVSTPLKVEQFCILFQIHRSYVLIIGLLLTDEDKEADDEEGHPEDGQEGDFLDIFQLYNCKTSFLKMW